MLIFKTVSLEGWPSLAEGAGLENQRGESLPEFESQTLRQNKSPRNTFDVSLGVFCFLLSQSVPSVKERGLVSESDL